MNYVVCIGKKLVWSYFISLTRHLEIHLKGHPEAIFIFAPRGEPLSAPTCFKGVECMTPRGELVLKKTCLWRCVISIDRRTQI
jgi:hypothetical protein